MKISKILIFWALAASFAINSHAGTPGSEYWHFTTGDQVRSSAAVGADGTVYFGMNNYLYAVNPDGTTKWSFFQNGLLDSSPAIGADGTIYVGGEDGNLYAVTDNGQNSYSLKWAFPTGGTIVFSSPAIGPDGTVYIGSNDVGGTPPAPLTTGKLYAVTDNGASATLKWAFPTGELMYSSPAISADGTVYFGSHDGNLYAIKDNGASATQKWTFATGSPIDTSPAIGTGGTIYFGADNGKLYAVTDNVTSYTQKWAFTAGGYISSSPAIGLDGTVYVGSADGKLNAVTDNGTSYTAKWAFSTGGLINQSSPAIGADGTIYIGARDLAPLTTGKLYAVTDNGATGTQKWVFAAGGYVDSSPAVAPDGTVYVGSKDYNLYAVFSDSLGLAKSAWPMYHQNLRHTALGAVTITATADANGTISPSGAVSVAYGADQSFTITPNTGYHVADVLVDNVTVGAVTNYPFTNVTDNHTIAASFAINSYTITATAGANGTISPIGDVAVNYGGSQPFTITPDPGYHVADVLVDGVTVGAVTSHTITNVADNHTIAASFALNVDHTITASAGQNGSISPNGPVQVAYGVDQGFTITPDDSYHVTDVLVDGTSVGAVTSYTFTNVTADHTIAASFAFNSYFITAAAGPNGSISPNGSVPVAHGADLKFTITPNTGYHVADVQVNTVSVGPVTSYTFTNVTSNQTITASFAINVAHTITATAGGNGTISPNGAVSVAYGADQGFTITPNAGYHVADVLVGGVSVGAVSGYTFTNVIADQTISASFAVNTYTITATAGGNGSITPSGSVTLNYGDSQSFTITPNSGYHVADVLVDGLPVGAVTSYAFTSVADNHTIAASFAVNLPHTITASAGPHGTITPAGSMLVSDGGSQGFTITPDANYNIKTVVVDGVDVGPLSSYTFNGVTTDHTITATFGAMVISILTDKNQIRVPPGNTAPLRVKLSDQPSTDVVVTVAWQSGSQALSIQGVATLTFTSANWDTYQTVQIAATPDNNDMNATAVFDLSGPGLTGKQVTAIKGQAGGITPILNLLLE
jgi:outer membrane protein assembly factor BamB